MKNSNIELWIADLRQCYSHVDACFAALSQQEQARAHSMNVPDVKDRYIASHFVKREVLSQYLKIEKKAIAIETSRFGKPHLASTHASNLVFNVSHAKYFCAIAVGFTGKIGVDVEYINPEIDFLRIAERFFSKDELLLLSQADEARRLFFRLWSHKEAVLKAIGKGLHAGLDQTVFDEAMQLRFSNQIPANELSCWNISEYDALENFSVAVAKQNVSSDPKQTLSVRQWAWPVHR